MQCTAVIFFPRRTGTMATFPLINSVRLDFIVFFIRHWFKTLAVHYRVMMHSISSLLSLLRNFFLFLRLNELFMQKKNCQLLLSGVVFVLLCYSFGWDLSIRWLQSLLFSFLESFLVSQPIMVSSPRVVCNL